MARHLIEFVHKTDARVVYVHSLLECSMLPQTFFRSKPPPHRKLLLSLRHDVSRLKRCATCFVFDVTKLRHLPRVGVTQTPPLTSRRCDPNSAIDFVPV